MNAEELYILRSKIMAKAYRDLADHGFVAAAEELQKIAQDHPGSMALLQIIFTAMELMQRDKDSEPKRTNNMQ